MPLRVLCDENIPEGISASLSERGFDVARVVPGTPDQDIARMAKREKRALLTFDSDFANILVYPPQDFAGIIRINIKPPLVHTIESALNHVFRKFRMPKTLQGKLIIVEPMTFRVWENNTRFRKAAR